MIRDIITIDENNCTGCGDCVPGCPEGALQIIDGKARLISDIFCDGLGACVGECPTGALKVEKREAQVYDEKKTMVNIMKAGANTIKAHLSHLKDHGEHNFYNQAIEVLKENNLNPDDYIEKEGHAYGCPGAKMIDRTSENTDDSSDNKVGEVKSELKQWPIQLHLVSPNAPYFQNSDILIAADCAAYSIGDFHSKHLKGKSLGIACPKLDSNQEIYKEKIKILIEQANINTITVMIMVVPCCSSLLSLVKEAVDSASVKVPIKAVVVDLNGDILKENWV